MISISTISGLIKTEIQDLLPELGGFLVRALRKELQDQGHVATGHLLDSISFVVNEFSDGLTMAIELADYGLKVEEGVPPDQVPGIKVHVSALLKWMRIKGLTSGLDKSAVDIAFRIARAHKKEGIPTAASVRFSKNGRTIGFMAFVLKNEAKQIDKQVEEISVEGCRQALFKIVDSINQKYAA